MRELIKFKNIYLVFIGFILLQILLMRIYPPDILEGWISDVAYHLTWEANGWMAKDIPCGASWSTGYGKILYVTHYLFYKIFGVGLFQARLVSFISAILIPCLLYIWTRKNISKEIALFSALLLTVSATFYLYAFLFYKDVLYALFVFISFSMIASGILSQRNIYFLLAGLCSGLSIDVCWRGIENVLTVYILHCFFINRKTVFKHSLCLLLGSFIAAIYWVCVSIIPIGFSNFVEYGLGYGDHGLRFSSEIDRIVAHLFTGSLLKNLFAQIEVIYLLVLLIIFYKYGLKNYVASKIIILWIAISFIVMSFVDDSNHPVYVLVYSPYVCILCGIGLYELFKRNKLRTYILLIFIIFVGFVANFGRCAKYFYHSHIKKDYDLAGYFEKLRSAVDLNKNIFGSVDNWYAFPDTQYYGGVFYLDRVIDINHELKRANEYENDYDRAKDLLNFFKNRKIVYIIADECVKKQLITYFPDHRMPLNNFELIDTIEDYYLGSAGIRSKHQFKTEIYKIISYDF